MLLKFQRGLKQDLSTQLHAAAMKKYGEVYPHPINTCPSQGLKCTTCNTCKVYEATRRRELYAIFK